MGDRQLRDELNVVGRQRVVLRAGEGLEVSPRLRAHRSQELVVVRGERRATRRHRTAERIRDAAAPPPRARGPAAPPAAPAGARRATSEQAAGRDRRARDHLRHEHAPGAAAPPRCALAAAVSHSSRPRLRDRRGGRASRRSRAAISYAWLARKASCSATRATSVCEILDGGPEKRRAGFQARRAARASCSSAQAQRQRHRGERDRRPRRPGCPAGPSSRASSSASVAGAIRLRRRLSRIFQRDDERQAIALQARARRHERKQPPQDLPVAAHPAVLAPRVREHARRIVVDDLDVGDERGARVEALEQVVRQQRVLGHAAVERRRRTRRRRRGPCR